MARAVTLRVGRLVTYWKGTPPRPVPALITAVVDADTADLVELGSRTTRAAVDRQVVSIQSKPYVTNRWSVG